MAYVLGFAPWLCYGALSGFDWRLGAAAAAVAALFLLARSVRRRSPDLLGAATAVFFTAMAALALADPESGLRHWTSALANGALALTALASIAVRQPFTLVFARAEVPEEHWHSPLFLRVNLVITAIWTVSFAVAAAACALVVHVAPSAATPLIAVQVLGFVVPFVTGSRYAAGARRAAERAADAPSAA